MDTLQRILEFLGWHRSRARPIALEASPFRKLPLELIFLIGSYLPLESAATLSLSCNTLHSFMKTEYLKPLREAEYSVMNEFLRFVERDLPTHIVCPHCNKLHSMSSADRHLVSRSNFLPETWMACRTDDRYSYIQGGVYLEFSSTIFRMAMKAHRQGHDATKLLGLLSYGTHNIDHDGFVEQRAVAIRIQDGSFLARERRVFMVPSCHELPIPRYGSISICSHIQFWGIKTLLMDGIRIPHANEIEGYKNEQGIIYCEYCYSEFRVDFKNYGKAGNAMFVTKWIDIGEGRDVSDYKWRSRIGGHKGRTRAKIAFPRGSICAAFEQKSEFKFDSLLTEEDEKNLCRKSPYPWPDDTKAWCEKVKKYYRIRHGRFVPFWSRDQRYYEHS